MKSSYHQFRTRPKSHITMFPAAHTVDYVSSSLSSKLYGAKAKSVIFVYTENDLIALIERKSYKKFGKLLINKTLKDKKYVRNLIKWSEKNIDSLKEILKHDLSNKTLKEISDKELGRRYKKYCERYRLFHCKNTTIWWLAADSVEKLIKDYFKKRKINNIDKIIIDAVEPLEYKTENLKEELSLLEICEKIKKSGINRIESKNDLPVNIKKELKRHVDEFSSIPFGYNTGVVWDENHFIKKINNVLLLKKEPRWLIDKINNNIGSRKRKRDESVYNLKLPQNITNLVIMLRQFSYLQELKKTAQTKSHPLLQSIVKPEIARRLNIPAVSVDFLSADEICDGLKTGKLNDGLFREIGERKKCCVQIMENLHYKWLYGKEAEKFIKAHGLNAKLKNVTEFKGVTASGGIARGKIKICNLSTEINKVNMGDILVTAMTTPDFVPAIKKAAAIITDEGGITCHAAIVSRELKKPCVIGTKVATKLLKDGDIVEVDADKGVVRILK